MGYSTKKVCVCNFFTSREDSLKLFAYVKFALRHDRCDWDCRSKANLRRAVWLKCDARRPVEATGPRSSNGRGPVPLYAWVV